MISDGSEAAAASSKGDSSESGILCPQSSDYLIGAPYNFQDPILLQLIPLVNSISPVRLGIEFAL